MCTQLVAMFIYYIYKIVCVQKCISVVLADKRKKKA